MPTYHLIIDIQTYVTLNVVCVVNSYQVHGSRKEKKHGRLKINLHATVKQKMVKFQRTVVEPEFKKAFRWY